MISSSVKKITLTTILMLFGTYSYAANDGEQSIKTLGADVLGKIVLSFSPNLAKNNRRILLSGIMNSKCEEVQKLKNDLNARQKELRIMQETKKEFKEIITEENKDKMDWILMAGTEEEQKEMEADETYQKFKKDYNLLVSLQRLVIHNLSDEQQYEEKIREVFNNYFLLLKSFPHTRKRAFLVFIYFVSHRLNENVKEELVNSFWTYEIFTLLSENFDRVMNVMMKMMKGQTQYLSDLSEEELKEVHDIKNKVFLDNRFVKACSNFAKVMVTLYEEQKGQLFPDFKEINLNEFFGEDVIGTLFNSTVQIMNRALPRGSTYDMGHLEIFRNELKEDESFKNVLKRFGLDQSSIENIFEKLIDHFTNDVNDQELELA